MRGGLGGSGGRRPFVCCIHVVVGARQAHQWANPDDPIHKCLPTSRGQSPGGEHTPRDKTRKGDESKAKTYHSADGAAASGCPCVRGWIA